MKETFDLDGFTTQVDDTYQALRAFNHLLDQCYEYNPGGVITIIGYGIGQILRRQIDDLEEINSKVGDLVMHIRSQRAAPATGLPPGFITLPMYRPGLEDELAARAAATEASAPEPAPADPLSGVDFGQIARETNLKEETVRRVVARLLAEPHPDPDMRDNAAVSNG